MSAPTPAPQKLFFDLSARTKLRIGGSDRVRFLNGQLTNDVAKATPKVAITASILNAKGKMEAHLFVSQDGETFVIDADPELRPTLAARLERYVIADDVRVEDVSGDFSIFHSADGERPVMDDYCRLLEANRFRQPGWDIWVPMARRDEVFEQLNGRASFCDDACMEIFRVERGIGRWNREMSPEIIPVEAELEESSIDYDKGCYIGQEVISRMKMSGQRNKKLCGFISAYDAPLEAGMRIFPLGQRDKEAGWITSAVHSRRLGREIALGYMKRPFFHAGYRMDAISPDQVVRDPVRVEVADLPFTSERPSASSPAVEQSRE